MTDTNSPAPLRESQPWTLYVGDARAVLAGMPGQSANCIVTSPPYWGKRDYGVAGQYGHEANPGAYVDTMRDVFREARRVLADDGTCWLNLGDSYSASGGGATGLHAYLGPHLTTHRAAGLHAKNLLGLPWRVAFALQDGRLDRAERGHLAQAQRHARIGTRPAQLPARAAVPARQAARLLVRPGPDPRTRTRPAAAATADAHRGRTRPPGHPGSRTRPPKYGPGTREVTTARRYGGAAPHPRASQRAQPRRRVVDPHPPLQRDRTSPPTRSTFRCAASRPAANRAAPCSTRSPGAARPAWPRSSSAAGSPGSTCRPTSRAWPPKGSPRQSPTGQEGTR